MKTRRSGILAAVVVLAIAMAPLASFGHAERPTLSPVRPGSVPDLNRVHDLVIDVCKTGECPFEHIQAAVDSIPEGKTTPTLIQVWPGLYKEEPSRAAPDLSPDNPDGTYSYEFQKAHPNAINLIAIVGKHNVTIRGMGAVPRDVVIDDGFAKHVGLRADRADGFIIQNVSQWHAREHGIYIMDQDGFVIDNVVAGYSGEYPFLTFATDHGLYQNCEAFGGGDAGIYPGGSADTPGRVSTEIRNCKAYRNVNGYSGTQGDHVWVHDSEFFDNGLGLVSDSETDHPNYPQNNLIFEHNKIYDNNFDYYSPDSEVAPVEFDEAGPGLNGVALPIGVGVFIPSGNNNLVQNNDIWGNARIGVWLASGEGTLIGPTSDPSALPFISSGNRFTGNRMYAPAGVTGGKLNGTDFEWDGMGVSNCWQDNFSSPEGGGVTTDALYLPACEMSPIPLPVGIPNVLNFIEQLSLAKYNSRALCDYIGYQPCSFGPGPAPGKARNLSEAEGGTTDRSYLPSPTPCGPTTPCPAAKSAAHVQAVRFHASESSLPATGVSGAPMIMVVLLLAGSAVGIAILRHRG